MGFLIHTASTSIAVSLSQNLLIAYFHSCKFSFLLSILICGCESWIFKKEIVLMVVTLEFIETTKHLMAQLFMSSAEIPLCEIVDMPNFMLDKDLIV